MPKIMHINCAVTGSTGKIISDIADSLKDKGVETSLCAPCAAGSNPNITYFRTSLPWEQGIYWRFNRLYGYQYGFAPLSTWRIKRRLKREKPDLVHIHCVNGFMVNVYKLFAFLKKQGIPTVITNHAEFFYTGNCGYSYECDRWMTGCGDCPMGYSATYSRRDTSAKAWKRMRDAFKGLNNSVLVSVSPWVDSRASQSPITRDLDCRVVLNGVNMDVFHRRTDARKRLELPMDKKVVFHPTAHFSASPKDRKGGVHLLNLARKLPEVQFYVAGQHTEELQIPENVTLLGRISDQDLLADYYAAADLTVITSKKETFNMPVAESLCCGTPVAGFLAGGPESIAIGEFCRFCDYGDVDTMAENVASMLQTVWDKNRIAQMGEEKYASAVMSRGYADIYWELLGKEDI